jgi:hypothetical protein
MHVHVQKKQIGKGTQTQKHNNVYDNQTYRRPKITQLLRQQ